MPRDFEPAIGDCLGVYLYSIDDLEAACQQNRRDRDRELPAAIHIIEQETGPLHGRSAPSGHRARSSSGCAKAGSSPRRTNSSGCSTSCPSSTSKSAAEIGQSFDRLVNKLLHPPLESLRSEAEKGPPHGLLDALKRLFQLRD